MRDGSEGQERKREMITREDFLEHGFKPMGKPFKTSFWIRLSKDEMPRDSGKDTNEYKVLCWTYHEVNGEVICKPVTMEKHVWGERIAYRKGGLRIFSEWAAGDDRLRHAYMTNVNSEYYWNEYCPLNMDFDGLIASFLRYLQNEKKNSIGEYRKEIAKLKKEHEREIKGLDKKIGLLKGVEK